MILRWKDLLISLGFIVLHLFFRGGGRYGGAGSIADLFVMILFPGIFIASIWQSIAGTISYRRRRKEEFARIAAGEDIPFHERVTTDEYLDGRKDTPKSLWVCLGISTIVVISIALYKLLVK